MTNQPPTRWGILSAGWISKDFTRALTSAGPPGVHKVVAVAARKKEDAENFAENFGIPKAYGGYENLENDPEIDVVYIGTIHIHHAEQSKRMLRAGKNVLCEKPATMNSQELEDVLAVARETGKFYMEALWSRCFPMYDVLRQELSVDSVGEVKIVSAEFGFALWHVPRMNKKALGGGSLLDLGCYCVQFADLVFGPGMPETISATGILTGEVDEAVSITLLYPGKKMAVLMCSATTTMTQSAVIRGTKGQIEIPMMWRPEEINLPSGKKEVKLPDDSGYHFDKGQGMIYEANEVRECLIKGLLESPKISHSSSRNIMAIMDEVRRQIGVVYDA